jgi:hypothetical protein
MASKPYPTDVTDDAWALVAAYRPLMREDALQREHPMCEPCNGLRWMVRIEAAWR